MIQSFYGYGSGILLFSVPPIKYQGHTVQKIVDSGLIWAFAGNNSGVNSHVAMQRYVLSCFFVVEGRMFTGDPLHSRAACTQPCNVNTHSRAHCSPGARLCEQWGHGCVNNGARLCASARLCRGSPVMLRLKHYGLRAGRGYCIPQIYLSFIFICFVWLVWF